MRDFVAHLAVDDISVKACELAVEPVYDHNDDPAGANRLENIRVKYQKLEEQDKAGFAAEEERMLAKHAHEIEQFDDYKRKRSKMRSLERTKAKHAIKTKTKVREDKAAGKISERHTKESSFVESDNDNMSGLTLFPVSVIHFSARHGKWSACCLVTTQSRDF